MNIAAISKEQLLDLGTILLIDKPLGWTSNDVVSKVRLLLRKYFAISKIKVGHAGTLDPLATGLMVLCVGKKTKDAMHLTGEDKEYEAQFTLGATTPSHDMETAIDAQFPTEHITDALLQKEVEKMCGEQMQQPPIFSAKRINGKRAYKLARRGESEESLPAVPITIHKFEILRREGNFVQARIRCSKGTYIRAIARDLGRLLASGAYLSALRRTGSGAYTLAEAVTLEMLEKYFEIVASRNLQEINQ
ncbi:MAG: tRNA pseudouridine(55) synthase TruB [Bacteroides sp.]